MNCDFSVRTVEQVINPLPSAFRIYEASLVDQILDLNAVTEASSLVPFEIQPLRSSATYPVGDYAIGDLDESLDRKRMGADIES
jgi:hypothetical protein